MEARRSTRAKRSGFCRVSHFLLLFSSRFPFSDVFLKMSSFGRLPFISGKRKSKSKRYRAKYPTKVPVSMHSLFMNFFAKSFFFFWRNNCLDFYSTQVILERHHKESSLPLIRKNKSLVDQKMTMYWFVEEIRLVLLIHPFEVIEAESFVVKCSNNGV